MTFADWNLASRPENLPHNLQLVAVIRDWAERKEVSPAQVALAWLMHQRPWIVPIPGTTQLAHLQENIGAADLRFTPAELAELDTAVRSIEIQGGAPTGICASYEWGRSRSPDDLQKLKPMKYFLLTLIGMWAASTNAQQPSDREAIPFSVGDSLGVRLADGSHEAMSDNVKVFGAIVAAESCTFDTTRGLIVVVNRGAPQAVRENDAWVSLLHPDGSVHTPYWIGNGQPRGRDATAPPAHSQRPAGQRDLRRYPIHRRPRVVVPVPTILR